MASSAPRVPSPPLLSARRSWEAPAIPSPVRASDVAQALACRGERKHVRADHGAPRAKPRPRVVAAGEQLCLAV